MPEQIHRYVYAFLAAGLVAWWAWGETLRPSALFGYLLICLSVGTLAWDGLRRPATRRLVLIR